MPAKSIRQVQEAMLVAIITPSYIKSVGGKDQFMIFCSRFCSLAIKCQILPAS